MKLFTLTLKEATTAAEAFVGAECPDGRHIANLSALVDAFPEFGSMSSLIASGEAGLEKAYKALNEAARTGQHVLPMASLRILPPLPRPPLIRDFCTMDAHMLNYLRIRAEEKSSESQIGSGAPHTAPSGSALAMPASWRRTYLYHIANPLNVLGHEGTLAWPRNTEQLDYELELAAVIGKTVKDIRTQDARDCIFGFTLMNDFTSRDIQRREGRPSGKSKDFDGSYSLGPCIVTRDEFPDIYKIGVRSRLNGEVQCEDSTTKMQITFEDLLCYISTSTTVHSGEIFASGTFELGCGFETGRMLADGDVIELEAEGIGTLRNHISRKTNDESGRQI